VVFSFKNVVWLRKKNKKSEEEFFPEISIMTENYRGADNLKRE
jgi:hypothetical protein